jgi:MFS family permease
VVIGGASDAQGRKRWLLIREALSIFIGVLSIFAGSWQLLAIVMIFLGFEGALYNVWTALVADSFEAKKLGYTLCVLSTFSTAMGLIATFSAGFIAKNYGFKTVFILSTIFSCLPFLLVLFKQHETVSVVESHFNVREAYRSLMDS